jgi:hypothetical protein
LKPKFLHITALQKGHILISTEEHHIFNKIKECPTYDALVQSAIDNLGHNPTPEHGAE